MNRTPPNSLKMDKSLVPGQWHRWLLLPAITVLALSALLPLALAQNGLDESDSRVAETAVSALTTVSQPYLITDINQVPQGSYPNGYVKVGSQIFFSAMDDDHGRELWLSDGAVTDTDGQRHKTRSG